MARAELTNVSFNGQGSEELSFPGTEIASTGPFVRAELSDRLFQTKATKAIVALSCKGCMCVCVYMCVCVCVCVCVCLYVCVCVCDLLPLGFVLICHSC